MTSWTTAKRRKMSLKSRQETAVRTPLLLLPLGTWSPVHIDTSVLNLLKTKWQYCKSKRQTRQEVVKKQLGCKTVQRTVGFGKHCQHFLTK